MPLSNICLANLGELNEGNAQHMADKALAAAMNDTEDRGEDGKERVVTMQVRFLKINGNTVKIGMTADFKPPKYVVDDTIATIKAPDRRGAPTVFQFRSDSPNNPQQTTFRDVETKAEGEVDE